METIDPSIRDAAYAEEAWHQAKKKLEVLWRKNPKKWEQIAETRVFRVTGGMDKEKIVFHLAARDRALRDLSLAFCSRIDNQRLSHVARIPTLLSLSLRGCTSVGDAGLAWVAALPRLRVLNLRGCTGVSDFGMMHVSHIPRLEVLDVSFCPRVSDNGLQQHIAPLPLAALYVEGNDRVTDAALRALAHVPEVFIAGSGATGAGAPNAVLQATEFFGAGCQKCCWTFGCVLYKGAQRRPRAKGAPEEQPEAVALPPIVVTKELDQDED